MGKLLRLFIVVIISAVLQTQTSVEQADDPSDEQMFMYTTWEELSSGDGDEITTSKDAIITTPRSDEPTQEEMIDFITSQQSQVDMTSTETPQNIATSETSQYVTVAETSEGFATSETSRYVTETSINTTTSETYQDSTLDISQTTTASETFQDTTSQGASQDSTSQGRSESTTEAVSQNTTTTGTSQDPTEVVSQNTTTTGTSQDPTEVVSQNTTTTGTSQDPTEAVSQNTTTTGTSQDPTEAVSQNTTTTGTSQDPTEAVYQNTTTTGTSQDTTEAVYQNTTTTGTSQDTTEAVYQNTTTTGTSRDTTEAVSQNTTTTGTSQDTTEAVYQNTTTTGTSQDTTEVVSQNTTTTGTSQDTTEVVSQNTTTTGTSLTTGTTFSDTTSSVSVATNRQRDLYPWGVGASDLVITGNSDNYYWNDLRSEPIYFTGGVPCGSDKFTVAHVHSNGVITFGTRSWAWWPNFDYASQDQLSLLAPFWFQTNYRQSGKVYYQLYESKNIHNQISSNHKNVLDRSSREVNEFYGMQHFTAQTVLVATWHNVEPYSWYTWLCEYYYYYQNEWWWQEYYSALYRKYCISQIKETSTFQAVYITDGQEAYVIVTYKSGEMNWIYEEGRPIVVGFITTDEVMDYKVSYTDMTTKMDSIVWNTGRYGTWIEKVGKIVNFDSLCMKFYTQNFHLTYNSTHKRLADALFDCPCSLERMGRQWWTYSWEQVPGSDRTYRVCYAIGITAKVRIERLRGNPLNKLCCYLLTYPNYWYWDSWLESMRNAFYIRFHDTRAGHLLLNDPWYWWGNARKSREEDFNPHKWCCESSSSPSKFCAYFNIVRPDYGCSPDAEFISGVALGDPHMKTLDNKDYTLNALGEYIILSITEVPFMLQGRTQQALNSEGNKTSATVFVAFAAKEGNNITFQVELDSAQTGMVISACDVDVTRDFYKDEFFNNPQCDNSIDVTRGNKTGFISVVAFFPCGVSLEVYVGLRNLEFSTNVPKSFKGKTSGLLGNFNDNPNDDFVCQDGKILTVNETDTERKIFYNFGQDWQVNTGNSVFKYSEGESALDYQFPSFVPIFREEVNEYTLNEALKICEEDDAACIFDYIATRDEKFAINTKNNNKETNNVKNSQMNNLPTLTLVPNQLNSKQQWEVTHDQPASITFNADDADNDEITYLLKGNSSQDVIINSSGVITYTPDSAKSVIIGVQAKDSKGGLSPIIFLNIVVCPACSGHGTCDKNRTREEEKEGGKFVLNVCNCKPAYTGEDCEDELNGCASSPCSRGQNCTDLSASEQGDNEIGYSCGSCPHGFRKAGDVCADLNECIENATDSVCPKNAVCTNTVGSYLCSCDCGFRQDPVNSSHCKDIDECTEKTHKCDHICQNLEGSYSCSCYDGNKLNSDNKTCAPVNPAACHGCNQSCIMINGTASCSCKTGYQLSGTTDCIDIDECKSANTPCSHSCQNTEGSFVCSCYHGYKLTEDGVSCTACNQPYYGENCASLCVCNGRGSCNHIRGCQCRPEWTGVNCNQDVNECIMNMNACPSGQICANTYGSYKCSCSEGYFMSHGVCEDLNECDDVLKHNCSLSMEDCINNKGSYRCRCKAGYALIAVGVCEDIDECAKNNHGCEQLCENTPGSYNCKCCYGYRLDTDRVNCVKRETDVCAGVTDLVCDQVCTVNFTTNTPYCKCNSGYYLTNKTKCLDIDECKFDHVNLCEYKEGCTNTDGGYSCSCLSGSMLDNDGRSCVVCSGGKWGMQCAEDCACSSGASYCDPKRGCVCKSGYTGTYCEKDIDECKTGSLICKAGENCVNKPGSASCECLSGYTRIGTSCQDINECASVKTNDCDQVCDNYEGGYSCSCNVGYSLDRREKVCQDIDECALKLAGCEQICENSNGGYRCSCFDGMKLHLDGVTCVVTSKCVNKTCDDKCAIVNGKETCFCPKGKVLDSTNDSKCLDVDMCENNTCSNFSSCKETLDGTSFTCSCSDGQKLAKDGFTCVDCDEGTFGKDCSQRCACNTVTTQLCRKIDGACICKAGWSLNNCSVDINECTSDPISCPNFSQCVNTPGSFVCKCHRGYRSVNDTCQECPNNTYGEDCSNQCTCDLSHGTCDKVSGQCVCQAGWTGVNCDTDIDECAQGDPCNASNIEHWECLNKQGNYTCGCKTGYNWDTKNNKCADLDECAADFSNECSQNCTNTDGGYLCSCNKGYQLGTDDHKCEDIDECSRDLNGCQHECKNIDGSYECFCHDGYQIRTDNTSMCYEALEIKTEITITMDVTLLNLREHQGKDYLELKAAVELALNHMIKKLVKDMTRVLVTLMRKGSLIVDFTTIVDKLANPGAASDMTEAIVLLFQNGIIINETHYSVAVKIRNITVDATTDKCTILQTIEACRDDAQCVKDVTGRVSCKKQLEDSNDDVPLIVGLSVGLPLGAALIVAIVAALWYKKMYRAQKRIHNKEDLYNDNEQASSQVIPHFSVYPAEAQKSTDKQNLFQ